MSACESGPPPTSIPASTQVVVDTTTPGPAASISDLPKAAAISTPLPGEASTVHPTAASAPQPIVTPVSTPTSARANDAPTGTNTRAAQPTEALSTQPPATPSRAPVPMASTTPTHTEGATPQPTATATPQPMTFPTEAPSPQPTAFPTLRELAAVRLAGFIPWINVPQDAAHEQATEVLTNISIASPSLGDHLVQLEWVADGVTDGEARTLGLLGDIVVRDLGLAEHMAYLPWITDGIASDEIASKLLLGKKWSERYGNLGDGVDCISRQKRCACSIPYLKFAVGSKRHHAEGDRRSRSPSKYYGHRP